MGEASVVVTTDGGVGIVRLNEPRSMNAMSPGIKAALMREVPRLVADDQVRCLLVTGTGEAFSAGGDIKNMARSSPADTRKRMADHHAWCGPLLTAEKPVVMAVNGAAAGGGFGLALMGDIVIASRTAYFTTGFLKIGVVPDLGLLVTLPRAVGMMRARDMIMTSRKVAAEEALQMGLVSRVVEPDQLMPEAMKAARSLAEGPTVAIGLTKRLLKRTYESSIDDFLGEEALSQAAAMTTDDFLEGITAFKEKRRPSYTGR